MFGGFVKGYLKRKGGRGGGFVRSKVEATSLFVDMPQTRAKRRCRLIEQGSLDTSPFVFSV